MYDGGGHGGGGAGCRLSPAAVGGEVAVAGNADAGSQRDGAATTERLCHGNAETFTFRGAEIHLRLLHLAGHVVRMHEFVGFDAGLGEVRIEK